MFDFCLWCTVLFVYLLTGTVFAIIYARVTGFDDELDLMPIVLFWPVVPFVIIYIAIYYFITYLGNK